MTHEPTGYPRIEDLAVVGDGRSVALLGPSGQVESFCPLRVDAPPLVWPLLDRDRGGSAHRTGRRRSRSPVLSAGHSRGVLQSTGSLGRARSTIAMRWPGEPGVQELLWLVECVDGQMTFEVKLDPRPDFGRAGTRLILDRHLVSYTGEHPSLGLASPVAPAVFGTAVVASGTLRRGERWGVRLRVTDGPTASARQP